MMCTKKDGDEDHLEPDFVSPCTTDSNCFCLKYQSHQFICWFQQQTISCPVDRSCSRRCGCGRRRGGSFGGCGGGGNFSTGFTGSFQGCHEVRD